MRTTTLPQPIRLPRAWAQRMAENLVGLFRASGAAWQRLAAARSRRADAARLADLSAATLADIGAPDWLISEARAERDRERERHIDMLAGARYGELNRW